MTFDANTIGSKVLKSIPKSLLICLAFVTIGAGRTDADQRPNFVMILCDDLGYGDLACYGHPHIRTPNLNRMAENGIRLTSCYASAPVCSSSRAGLLTGRNPNRGGVHDWIPGGHPVHLRANETTVANLLQNAGYQTALVGKWHLNGHFNDPRHPQPDDHGFDHWMATQNNASPSHQQPSNFVRNGNPLGKLDGFSCDEVAAESNRWLSDAAKSDSPFYLHVCFHEPHEPVESPQDLVDSYSDVAKNADQAQYFANVTNMDAAVGKILAKIDELGIADDTLVMFTSDNGPETLERYQRAKRSYGSPGPLREMKLHVYEGGIRVPGIVHWPGQLEAGKTLDTPVSGVDWLPTVCGLADIPLPVGITIDGSNMAPAFNGNAVSRKLPLHWTYYRSLTQPKFAIRDGKWKLLAGWTKPTGGMLKGKEQIAGSNVTAESLKFIHQTKLTAFELYDLDNDIGEANDLSAKFPEVVENLGQVAKSVFADVVNEAPKSFLP